VRILGLDFECSGMDPENCAVTEVGAVLWDTTLHAPTRAIGYLVNPGTTVWDSVCEQITGITPQLCEEEGYSSENGLKQLLRWYNLAEAICAHNGNRFDKFFFKKWCQRHDLEVEDKLWIDTMTDLPLPPKNSRKLTYMAAEHGFLNPFPHRAMFDVMTMLKIMDCYPLEEVLKLANSPMILLEALVSYENRGLAKTGGYYWKGERKQWLKDIKECALDEERDKAAELGFKTRVIPAEAPSEVTA
jgi:DNA polymerase-3 subunit epsilon